MLNEPILNMPDCAHTNQHTTSSSHRRCLVDRKRLRQWCFCPLPIASFFSSLRFFCQCEIFPVDLQTQRGNFDQLPKQNLSQCPFVLGYKELVMFPLVKDQWTPLDVSPTLYNHFELRGDATFEPATSHREYCTFKYLLRSFNVKNHSFLNELDWELRNLVAS